MQIIIFLIEVVLIFFLVDMDNYQLKNTKIQDTQYTSYYSSNEFGDTILILKDIPQKQKIIIWKNSSLIDEMLIDFPDLSAMSQFVEHRVIDDEVFKDNLIEYMEYIQGKYLSGEITQEEFKKAIKNPDFSLPIY